MVVINIKRKDGTIFKLRPKKKVVVKPKKKPVIVRVMVNKKTGLVKPVKNQVIVLKDGTRIKLKLKK